MNRFLDDFFNKNQLTALEEWGKKFWKIEPGEVPAIFAQRGFEDKGLGHIQWIISNAGELLEKYHNALFRLNSTQREDLYNSEKKKEFKDQFTESLGVNLLVFYLAAHLHDIGMKFPGIFEALSDLVAAGGDHALHIGEIIHNYHNYASFIVLLELSNCEFGEEESKKSPYFSVFCRENIDKDKNKKRTKDIRKLLILKKELSKIYSSYIGKIDSSEVAIEDENEFLVILGILCLFHQEVNMAYVQSIIRNYEKANLDTTVRLFNKWWDIFKRADQCTEIFKKRLGRIKNFSIKKFSGSDSFLVPVKDKQKKISKLDLNLVEALLQYGDKTEITVARLARKVEGLKLNGETCVPLKELAEAVKYDNRKGNICTDMAQRAISPFARFRACRFIPTLLVEVQDNVKDNRARLDIVFHYYRFKQDEEIFRIIRFHNEKDFHDLGFLDVIKIHIPLILSRIHNPLILSRIHESNFKVNPFFDFHFKKMEHPFLNFDEELIKLLGYFFDISGNQMELNRNVVFNTGKDEEFLKLFEKLKALLNEFGDKWESMQNKGDDNGESSENEAQPVEILRDRLWKSLLTILIKSFKVRYRAVNDDDYLSHLLDRLGKDFEEVFGNNEELEKIKIPKKYIEISSEKEEPVSLNTVILKKFEKFCENRIKLSFPGRVTDDKEFLGYILHCIKKEFKNEIEDFLDELETKLSKERKSLDFHKIRTETQNDFDKLIKSLENKGVMPFDDKADEDWNENKDERGKLGGYISDALGKMFEEQCSYCIYGLKVKAKVKPGGGEDSIQSHLKKFFEDVVIMVRVASVNSDNSEDYERKLSEQFEAFLEKLKDGFEIQLRQERRQFLSPQREQRKEPVFDLYKTVTLLFLIFRMLDLKGTRKDFVEGLKYVTCQQKDSLDCIDCEENDNAKECEGSRLKELLVNLLWNLRNELGDSGNDNLEVESYPFINRHDRLKKKLLQDSRESFDGLKFVRKIVYKEMLKKIDAKDRFPYTRQNRKAILDYSRSILDPDIKKKKKCDKKVFFETGEIVIPYSFETMAILNLFQEE